MAEKGTKRISLYSFDNTVIYHCQCTHLEKHVFHLKVLEQHQSDVDEGKELPKIYELLSSKPVLLLPPRCLFSKHRVLIWLLFASSRQFIIIRDLTRNFVLHEPRMPLPKKGGTSVILMGDCGQSQGIKLLENCGQVVRASRYIIARCGPDLLWMDQS